MLNLSKESKMIILFIVIFLIISLVCVYVYHSYYSYNMEKIYRKEVWAVDDMRTRIIHDAYHNKKSHPEGITRTYRFREGNVTLKNGNINYMIVEYPNGTVVTRDFIGMNGYQSEYEYNVKYRNGSTLHFNSC